MLHGCLENGLTVCLSLLAHEPDRFEPAAVAWHSRWCSWLCDIGFDESQAVLTALEGLAGRDPVGAAHALRATCRSYGLDEVAVVLDGWIAHSRRSTAAEATPPAAA